MFNEQVKRSFHFLMDKEVIDLLSFSVSHFTCSKLLYYLHADIAIVQNGKYPCHIISG